MEVNIIADDVCDVYNNQDYEWSAYVFYLSNEINDTHKAQLNFMIDIPKGVTISSISLNYVYYTEGSPILVYGSFGTPMPYSSKQKYGTYPNESVLIFNTPLRHDINTLYSQSLPNELINAFQNIINDVSYSPGMIIPLELSSSNLSGFNAEYFYGANCGEFTPSLTINYINKLKSPTLSAVQINNFVKLSWS